MKKTLLIAMGLIACGLYAQQDMCGTVTDTKAYLADLKRIESTKKIRMQTSAKTASGTMRYVAINPVIYRKDDGTGGLTFEQLNTGLSNINASYRAIGIEFYISGAESDLTSINDSEFLAGNYTSSNESTNHGIYGESDAINIYFVDATNSGVSGYAPRIPANQSGNKATMANPYVTGKVLSHELGHYFNLIHTHQGSTNSDITKRELVTRLDVETGGRLPANCSTEGDLVCDTPADPYGRTDGTTTTNNCTFASTITDVNGDFFSPTLRNFMDYYFCDNNIFTSGQYSRMSDAYDYLTRAGAPFNFSAPLTVQSAPANVTVTLMSASVNTGATVSRTDVSAVETGYIVERATSVDGDYVPIGGVAPNTTEFADTKTEAGATYYYKVKPSNNPSISSISEAAVMPISCGMTVTNVCARWHYIQLFSLFDTDGTTQLIHNESTIEDGCSENSYGDFYNTFSATLEAGQTYSFRERPVYDNGAYSHYCNVYIDYNGDGDFDDANETIYAATSREYDITRSFAIPTDVTDLAEVRLRVITTYSNPISSACSTIQQGEYEDYKIVLKNETMGVNESLLAKSLQLYPNPNDGRAIYLKGKQANTVQTIKVYAANGQQVDVSFNKTQEGIEIVSSGNLSAGLYIVSITTDTETLQKKLIVK
ncbi:MAG: GEVED domain-containing protein [Aestuariibaculum sp.]